MDKLWPLALIATTVACQPNPACDDDVRGRLFEECKLSFVPPGAPFCIGDTSSISSLMLLERDRAFREDMCRAADPDVDADCLRETSCEQLTAGACSDPEMWDQDCFNACEATAFDCYETCPEETGPYEACANCSIRCVDQRARCLSRC